MMKKLNTVLTRFYKSFTIDVKRILYCFPYYFFFHVWVAVEITRNVIGIYHADGAIVLADERIDWV